DNRTGTDYSEFPYEDGDVLNIVGISSQFRGTFQIKPRKLGDLEKVDVISPVTTATIEGQKLSDDSYIGKAVISLQARDNDSGVVKIEYRLDKTDRWKTYTQPFAVTTDGNTKVEYRSVDNAGNMEMIKSLSITVTNSSYQNLYELVNNSNVHPDGLKEAIKAHAKSAERAVDVKKERKRLEQTMSFVNHLSDKHVHPVLKEDLHLFIQYKLDHLASFDLQEAK
ncbi:MAG TPA: hypothetical protein VF149_05295, partial [Bacillales bacterium]